MSFVFIFNFAVNLYEEKKIFTRFSAYNIDKITKLYFTCFKTVSFEHSKHRWIEAVVPTIYAEYKS